jgi:5-methylcytosine-specific restriction endonuclease McrA
MASTSRCDSIIRFFYNDYLGMENRYFVYVGKAEGGTLLGESFANALPLEIATFLSKYGACAACGRSVPVTLAPCPCRKPLDHGGHLKVVVVDRAGTPTLSDLLGREFERVKSATRQRRVRESNNNLTAAEVALLLDLQGEQCFYCGELLARNERGLVFHRDHYDALFAGGQTTIGNTVLACPSCNARKGTMDGASFSRLSARRRRPEIRSQYATMRRRFRAGLAKYLSKSHS